MQLTPFDRFTQNSFKLFDRGYRPVRPMTATSKPDRFTTPESGASRKVCCSFAGALRTRMVEADAAFGCSRAGGACCGAVAVGRGACCGVAVAGDSNAANSCFLFSKK